MDFDIVMAQELDFYSDASRNNFLGMGARYNQFWTYQKWDINFMSEHKPSIEFLELYAVAVAVVLWIHHFENRQVQIFCDNKSVCFMISQMSSSCKHCMMLIRIIVLKQMIHNTRIYAKHVKLKDNYLADHLSRLIKLLWMESQFRKNRTPIPSILWPMDKLWCE